MEYEIKPVDKTIEYEYKPVDRSVEYEFKPVDKSIEYEFKPVDRSLWRQCVDLNVCEAQRGFVATNAYSLAQAAYEPTTYPFAICRNGEVVGFIMYDYDDENDMWEMCRLMVDSKFQGQGAGSAAVKWLLGRVAAEQGHIKFYTSAEPNNEVAIKLYEKMGFRLTGEVVYGEVQMEIQL